MSLLDHKRIRVPSYDRIPARELLDLFSEKPDTAIIRTDDGLQGWTAGELRALAAKGQAVDLPRSISTVGTIWEIGS